MDQRAALLALAVLGITALAALPTKGGTPTYVQSEVYGIWTIDRSPYFLVDNVTVPAGKALRIDAGVEVRADRGVGLQILGSLTVNGTADAPVRFTANATAASPGFWVGLWATNATLVVLDHALVDDAETGFALVGGSASITGSSFTSNVHGLKVEIGSATIAETLVSGNTMAGVYARGASLSIRSSLFSGDYVGMTVAAASHALVENTTFLASSIGDLTLDTGSFVELRASAQQGKVKFLDAASRLDVEGILAVSVTDAFGSPVAGARVLVEDNGTSNATAETNHEGLVPGLVLLERQNTSAGGIDFNPFTVTATARGFRRTESVTVSGAANITLAVPADLTPPKPNADAFLTVDEGTPLWFDASASTDNDPTFATTGTFRWAFPDLGVALSGVRATYTFATPGTYEGVLTVTDAAGNGADVAFSVLVRDTKPPTITAVDLPDGGLVGETLAFHANATDDDRAFALKGSFVWRFALGSDAFERTGASVEIAFERPGLWAVTVVATDPTGNAASASRTISITAPPAPPAPPSAWPYVGGAAALLAAAIGLATERGKLGLLTLFLPLYTRLRDEEVLDQFTRGQIYGYIRVHPGDTYTDIKRNLSLNNGTLTYHLDVLERERLVRAVNRGSRKMFYTMEVRPAEDGGGLHEIQQRILRVLGEAPGAAVPDLAAVLGISRQLALYHLRLLVSQDLVRLERRGLRLIAFATGPPAPPP